MPEIKVAKYWEADASRVFKDLDSGGQGITEAQAKTRLGQFGPNEITSQKSRTAYDIIIGQLANPLLVILFVASLVSGFLGEWISALIIILMIGFSAVISFFQEYRSEKTVELLKKRVALKAEVIREGKNKTILARDLVVGDLVILNLGKVVPADLRLIEVDDLQINESVLTGESFPAEKSAAPQTVRDYLPQAMTNLAFAGTHVVSGAGLGLVISTGSATEFGKTARMLAGKEDPSQFQKGVSDFGIFLFKIIIVFSLAVFIFLALFRGNWLASLLFALSIAVGISPELLPMIITINLSRAARLMAKNQVIVKKLMAIEDLGNADILCTDKTGTLTEGKIILRDFFDFEGKENLELLSFAQLCNCHNFGQSRCRNPLDDAIVDYIKKINTAPS